MLGKKICTTNKYHVTKVSQEKTTYGTVLLHEMKDSKALLQVAKSFPVRKRSEIKLKKFCLHPLFADVCNINFSKGLYLYLKKSVISLKIGNITKKYFGKGILTD